jgi:hypothetical protein
VFEQSTTPLHGVDATAVWWALSDAEILSEAKALRALGGNVTRIETPEGGLFDYARLRFAITAFKSHDIKVFLGTTASDSALRAIVEFAADIVGVEIGNEPNNPKFFGGTASDYVALLRQQHQRVKAANPRMPVVGGAVALIDYPYIGELMAAGITQYIDAFSIHPYALDTHTGEWLPPDTSLSQLEDVWGLVRKPLWITELGYPQTLPTQKEWLLEAVQIINRSQHVDLASFYCLDGPFAVPAAGFTHPKPLRGVGGVSNLSADLAKLRKF